MSDNVLDQIFELLQLDRLLFLIVGIAIVVGIVRLINKAGKHLSDKFSAKRLLILQITTILGFMVYLLGVPLLVYTSLQPPKELLIALGGSLAVAIGFAIKDIVSSFVAGIVLLFDRPAQVGDRVQIGDTYGEVKSIGLRAVRLVTLDDNTVTIPNTKFITDHVSSGNSGELDMMVVCHFHTALDEDIDMIRDILNEVVITSRFAYLAKPVIINIDEVEIGMKLGLKFSVKAYVLDVRYEKAFSTDIMTRTTEVFNQRKIRRPQ